MENNSLKIFLEINRYNYIFFVGKKNENENFKIIYQSEISSEGIENNKIYDLEKTYNKIKKEVYIIEKKLNYVFKEIILILDYFNPTFINLTGYKKLNGSQVSRENITYILNTLKSCVEEVEPKKKVMHIFNSKFYLDDKKIENLPLGLFGEFYSHELSFILTSTDDYDNLKNIFDKCRLKIKKILIKSFVSGVNISENHKNIDTFFYFEINDKHSKVFFFENNSLQFEQNFSFGTDIIIQDISKITSLNLKDVKKILEKIENIKDGMLGAELIDNDLHNNSLRKIKKKLIYEIAHARIKEIAEITLFKNINLKYFNKINKNIYFKIDDKLYSKSFLELFKTIFSMENKFNIIFLKNSSIESYLSSVDRVVHYGWKKEAIPFSEVKKSILAQFFGILFK